MTITFLNVGYGEAILVECPDAGHPQGTFVMLIDGGSGEAEEFPPELPERAPLIKELERRGLDHIDVMISTHIHEDHVCGLLPVAKGSRPESCGKSMRPPWPGSFQACPRWSLRIPPGGNLPGRWRTGGN